MNVPEQVYRQVQWHQACIAALLTGADLPIQAPEQVLSPVQSKRSDKLSKKELKRQCAIHQSKYLGKTFLKFLNIST